MSELPHGTVTFLFTDIEGSTKRWEHQPRQMQAALARHDDILHNAIEANNGHVFKTMGDAFCAAFPTAPDALNAALSIQRSLAAESWGEQIGSLHVRAALHTGTAEVRGGDYFGPPLNRVARLLSAGHGGQTLLSLATQELVRDNLPEGVTLRDMGERRLKDLIRPERVFQLIVPGLPADFPPLRTLDARPNNLPAQPSPLIGREKELQVASSLLRQAHVRLVTFTGPGGTGKTRLALQLAADLVDPFNDGVFFVNLAPISDPGLVISTVAQTLGVKEAAGQPLINTLKSYLKEKEMLLLLDNFEQVVEASPQVGQLLASAPALKVLVTSRVPLRLQGEKEFPVPPLALPDARQLPTLEHLTQYEAVRLFIERATDVKPDFQVTNDNAPAVAEICHRLDGLPLAIELAAARIRLLPPQALVSRLQSRLKLLTGGARDLPARQQTLRGAIAWSYDLLNEGEKQLFRRMSVFVGGRTLEAIEAVCNADGDLQMDVLDGVGSLVANSLLRQDEGVGGEPRFVMLETIYEFARERLEESGEAEELRRRHALFFASLTEIAESELRGQNQTIWFARLDYEHDNGRAALRWAKEEGNAKALETGLRLAAGMGRFWDVYGHFTEGREWLLALLSLAETGAGVDAVEGTGVFISPFRGLGRAMSAAGWLAYRQGDYDAAHFLLERALEVARDVGDKAGMGLSLSYLGRLVTEQGDYSVARSLHEQSLTLYREIGDKWGVALSLTYLGQVVLEQGDYGTGRSLHEESLALRREIGDKWGVAFSLGSLSQVALFEGDYSNARSLQEQSLALRREMGDKRGTAIALNNLGNVVLMQRDYLTARALHEQSLAIMRELGAKVGMACSLAGLGEVRVESGQREQMEKGARLLGASDALLEAIGAVMEADDGIPYNHAVASARAQLGEEDFERLRAEGRAMSLEAAIKYALEENT